MSYPLEIRSSKAFIGDLYECEYGRYEDAQEARTTHDTEVIEAHHYEVVACDFLDEDKTVITVSNDAELCELYYVLASGTIGLYHCKAANNMLDKIRGRVQAINPALVKDWPYQTGN